MDKNYKEIRGVLVKKYRNLLGQYIFVINAKGVKSKVCVGKSIFTVTELNSKWTIGQSDGKLINIRPGFCKDSFKRKNFDENIDSLLKKANAMIPNEILPDLPFMEHAPDVHDWYRFEHELWEIGEEIRQVVSEYNMKFNSDQIDAIIKICLDKRAKRGRESFVLLLGKVMYGEYANKIISLLNDDVVGGHIIDTLYKMHAGQYVELVKPFLNHKRTWIRNEAKRYVQKYEN